MLKLLHKRNYLIETSKKSIDTQISKIHKIKYPFNTGCGIISGLIYMASIAYAIFTPAEPNNFLPLLFVFIGLLFLVLSGIIFTHYVSPYHWAIQIQKKETK